jgi:polysaccharide export outer membrane protein
VIYISNADAVELVKFLSLVSTVSATTAQVPNDALTVKRSVKHLTN